MRININSLETIAKQVSKYAKSFGKKSILQTEANNAHHINRAKNALKLDVSDFAFHGSPFNFDFFDAAKIGSGEGISKRGIGLYLFRTKKIAPFYSNLRSPDAPIHFGRNGRLEKSNPTIYTVSGLRNLKLKPCNSLEAKSISRNQKIFEESNPHIDGLELQSGEICIFPKSIEKINILNKSGLDEFVIQNKDYPFRSWTTSESRIQRLGLPRHHLEYIGGL